MTHGHFMTATLDRKVKSVSTKMVSLISNLGAATLASLQRGETQVCRWCFGLLVSQDMLVCCTIFWQEMDSVDANGSGIKMAVSKPSVSEVPLFACFTT